MISKNSQKKLKIKKLEERILKIKDDISDICSFEPKSIDEIFFRAKYEVFLAEIVKAYSSYELTDFGLKLMEKHYGFLANEKGFLKNLLSLIYKNQREIHQDEFIKKFIEMGREDIGKPGDILKNIRGKSISVINTIGGPATFEGVYFSVAVYLLEVSKNKGLLKEKIENPEYWIKCF